MSKDRIQAFSESVIAIGITVSILSHEAHSQQMADSSFNATVARPAYAQTHPTIVIDEAHSNFHTSSGRYKPFADLLKSDGYNIVAGTKKFDSGSLDSARVLVIANAEAPDADDSTSSSTGEISGPAFTEHECDVVRDWVRDGGSLLLIADHAPFGSAAENLARRFGVNMGKGYVFDRSNSEAMPTLLVYSRENGLLGDHPLLRGRDATEEVKRIVAFTGQSLGVPKGAVAFMKLGSTAYESPTRTELQAAQDTSEATVGQKNSVSGRAQGVAMQFGKGRVVIMAEAAMFSAQVVRFQNDGKQQEFKMGMNVSGNDDRQLALNVMHWLSGLLE